MDIFTFIKSLSRTERVTLSEEVACSHHYLTHAASRRHIGFDLAKRIYESDANAARPPEIQFSSDDWKEYQISRVNQKEVVK